MARGVCKGQELTVAGLVLEEAHAPGAQRPPLLMALLMASVSSVTPSPFAPKSLTFLKTWYPLGSLLNAARPVWLIFSSQNEHAVAEGEVELLDEDEEDDTESVLDEELVADDVTVDEVEDVIDPELDAEVVDELEMIDDTEEVTELAEDVEADEAGEVTDELTVDTEPE
jgi:hypothetical protein